MRLLKFFIDTEFIEDGKTIDLVSIGIVCENGASYYAISTEFNPIKASHWVVDNVLAKLPPVPIGKFPQTISSDSFWQPDTFDPLDPSVLPDITAEASCWKSRKAIALEVVDFIEKQCAGANPEFWGYYADYDWVVFCQLFGTMMDLPNRFPMYCRDIKQECDRLGNPEIPKQESGEHNALADAFWNKQAWEFLNAIC